MLDAELENNPSALKFRLNGKPIPLARPRFGKNRVFDSQKDLKLVMGISLREQMGNHPIFTEPLVLFMDFYFPAPSRLSQTKQQAFMGLPYQSRPDLDNLVKAICDYGLGIFYDDDALVVEVHASKQYGEPRTEIVIIPWSEHEKIR
jgi:Holliday junction resolvase RusA-like endonuclease